MLAFFPHVAAFSETFTCQLAPSHLTNVTWSDLTYTKAAKHESAAACEQAAGSRQRRNRMKLSACKLWCSGSLLDLRYVRACKGTCENAFTCTYRLHWSHNADPAQQGLDLIHIHILPVTICGWLMNSHTVKTHQIHTYTHKTFLFLALRLVSAVIYGSEKL